MTAPALGTASYKTFRPSMGLPVGITAYPARWRLPYRVAARLPDLAPERAWLRVLDDEFDRLFLGKLDRIGPEAIAEQLQRVAAEHDAARLVLLCFEAPAEPCHRRLLAEWWTARTGQDVPELVEQTDEAPAPPAGPVQPRLL